MRAIRVDGPREPHTLAPETIPDPRPSGDQVLVRVLAAGVNRSDALACRGVVPGRFPRTLGREFAGVVVAAGNDRHADLVGRRVWGCGGGDLGFAADGTHAELVLVDRSAVVETPVSMSDVGAGASALAYFTASAALDRAGGVRPGSTVLVTGAAGAVGAAAAALARRDGARVVGIVRNHEETTLVNDDIDIAVASDEPDLADLLKDHAQDARTLVDTVGGQVLADLLPVLGLGAGACILSAPPTGAHARLDTLDFYRREVRLSGLHTGRLTSQDAARTLAALADGFESGILRPTRAGGTYALESAAEAYRLAEEGGHGRPVLLPAPTDHPQPH